MSEGEGREIGRNREKEKRGRKGTRGWRFLFHLPGVGNGRDGRRAAESFVQKVPIFAGHVIEFASN